MLRTRPADLLTINFNPHVLTGFGTFDNKHTDFNDTRQILIVPENCTPGHTYTSNFINNIRNNATASTSSSPNCLQPVFLHKLKVCKTPPRCNDVQIGVSLYNNFFERRIKTALNYPAQPIPRADRLT